MNKFPVCLSCRRYGVRLIDNLCEPCYLTGLKPVKGLSPGTLAYTLNEDGDKRTSKTIATFSDREEHFDYKFKVKSNE